jgi:hypothetical protein
MFMSFADPLSIDIGAGAVSLPRVSVGSNQSKYMSADGNIEVVVSHRYSTRTRRVARVNVRKTAPDPLFPAQNTPFTMSYYVVIDVPAVGYTATEQVNIGKGLMTLLTASTNANLIKLSQGEN